MQYGTHHSLSLAAHVNALSRVIDGDVRGGGPRHAMGFGETSHQEGNVIMLVH